MSKLSPQFRDRLLNLGPGQMVRAIVLLDVRGAAPLADRRPPNGGRQQAIDAVRKAAEPALADIDGIIRRVGGRRLAPSVDALGAVPVETTADGINALANSSRVKAVLEDQPITAIPEP